MKLTVEKRETGKKGTTKQIRRDGNIPAILYSRGKDSMAVSVNGEDMGMVLRTIKNGTLSTTIFDITVEGKAQKAIVKDIQYHFTTYAIEHMDFILLDQNQPVNVSVPIELLGVADCAGVKLGGFIRQVIRSIKVNCLPKDIPQGFSLDVAQLGLGASRRLSDIEMPKGVKPLANMNEVAVVIGKKA